jgi:hypothetical protein
MAGFDLDKQKQMGLQGARMETGVGPTAFSTTATTVSVPTNLTTIIAGLAVCVTGGQGAVATTGAVSGSAATFTRAAGGTSGDTLQYILVGY